MTQVAPVRSKMEELTDMFENVSKSVHRMLSEILQRF